MKVINQMCKAHFSTKKEESDTKSESTATTGWKQGINSVQQMNIAQQYRQDNGMDSDKEVKSIDDNQLKGLRKKAKKAEKAAKRS